MNNRGGCKGQTAEYHGPLAGRNTWPPINQSQNNERLDHGCVTASARLVREAGDTRKVQELFASRLTDAGAGLPTRSHHHQKKESEMKKIVQEVSGEGLESLLGERVAIWCECYIYAGVLTGVNEHDILLEEAHIVYETGKLDEPGYKDAQPLPGPWYVRTAKIESYGRMI